MLAGEAPQPAIEQPRLNAVPGLVRLEPGFAPEVIEALQADGDQVARRRRAGPLLRRRVRAQHPRRRGRSAAGRGGAAPGLKVWAPRRVTSPVAARSTELRSASVPSSTYRLQIGPRSPWPTRPGSSDYLRDLGVGSGLPVADPAVHDRLRSRLRHHRSASARHRARGRGGLGGVASRPPSRPVSGSWSTSSPTTSGSRCRRRIRPGGTSCGSGRSRRTLVVRRRLGPPDHRADSGRRCRAHGAGRRTALLRAPVPARARHMVRGRRGRRRPRSAALRAGAPLPRQRRAQLPPVLRR